VEFHLRSKKAGEANDIVLIRDLQHQQWLVDNGKSFASMENYDWDWTANGGVGEERSGTAHVVAGG
jgi:hypothetical protein